MAILRALWELGGFGVRICGLGFRVGVLGLGFAV